MVRPQGQGRERHLGSPGPADEDRALQLAPLEHCGEVSGRVLGPVAALRRRRAAVAAQVDREHPGEGGERVALRRERVAGEGPSVHQHHRAPRARFGHVEVHGVAHPGRIPRRRAVVNRSATMG